MRANTRAAEARCNIPRTRALRGARGSLGARIGEVLDRDHFQQEPSVGDHCRCDQIRAKEMYLRDLGCAHLAGCETEKIGNTPNPGENVTGSKSTHVSLLPASR